MKDQAEKLRQKMLGTDVGIGRSIAVISGKGGVGKSNFTTNFAAMLAKSGKKVVILDMDIGMGNVHILVGKSVKYSLKDYLDGNLALEDVMVTTSEGMNYISGGSGMSSLMDWSPEVFGRLLTALETLQRDYDFVLFDMGAGIVEWSLELLTSLDEMIVISTAEPTSIMDAYSMMKFIHLKDDSKTFYILCNRAFNIEEGQDTTKRLKTVMEHFLKKEVVVLGSLPEDPVVRQAVRQQSLFTTLYPDAPISRTMQKIVQQFLHYQNEMEEVHAGKKSNKFISKLKSIFSKGRE
ncbi:MinD/ParA family protein [Solibacillus sp. MA9]|uniref:MinD/ParA family protein n=1 Tax=Solibacillus palustris TaxID=2908203 RepID=A0ABS9U9P8_9BACL|nr:MinD/ParA family protein [Solibacillus sp. MA9]MCH7320953.1 MinD/ParA family protein [Solibacillus sp. MA9]